MQSEIGGARAFLVAVQAVIFPGHSLHSSSARRFSRNFGKRVRMKQTFGEVKQAKLSENKGNLTRRKSVKFRFVSV